MAEELNSDICQSTTVPRDHFASLHRRWSHLGPPLAPGLGDTAIVQRIADGLGPAPRVVVLGLTPQIVGCAWPSGIDLIAVDNSPAMMRELWPPAEGPPGARALLADWRAMPIPSQTV